MMDYLLLVIGIVLITWGITQILMWLSRPTRDDLCARTYTHPTLNDLCDHSCARTSGGYCPRCGRKMT